jgi:hypothetical protein
MAAESQFQANKKKIIIRPRNKSQTFQWDDVHDIFQIPKNISNLVIWVNGFWKLDKHFSVTLCVAAHNIQTFMKTFFMGKCR